MVQNLPTVTREALRRSANPGGTAQTDLPFSKNALVESVSRNILTAGIRGVDPSFAAEAARGSFDRQSGAELGQYLESRASRPVPRDQVLPLAIASATQDAYEATENRRREIDFSDQVSASWDLYTGTSAIRDMITEESFAHDPGFDYMENREEIEKGLSYDSVLHLRENARSMEHAVALRGQELDREDKERTISANGAGTALLAGLVGGVADPAGWVAGLGVGKALQLAGVGSRALYLGGRTMAARGSIAAEGAVGNAAIEAMLDASGRRVDASDYAYSAAFGGAFGLGLSPVAFRGMNKEAAQAEFEGIMRESETQNARMYETAAANVGPTATADEIAEEVRNLHVQEGKYLDRIRMAMPGNQDRFMDVTAPVAASEATAPDATLRGAEDARAEIADTARLRVSEDEAALVAAQERNDADGVLQAQEDLAESRNAYRRALSEEPEFTGEAADPGPSRPQTEAERAYYLEVGLDGLAQTDPARAKMLADLMSRSDGWTARNPVDEARLNDLLSRAGRLTPQFASTAQQLLRSNHPTARMIVGLLLENTTGASGRRSSAAMDKAMAERVYMGEIEKLPHLYRQYRRANGGSATRDAFSGGMYQRFNDELTEYRLRVQRNEKPEAPDPAIKAASDMLDRFYDRARRDMIATSTPGHEALPTSSLGYFNRRLKPEAVQKLTNAQARALRAEYERQLTGLWDDPAFARQIAAQIVEHGRIAAAGGKEIPANIYSPTAAPLLRNALKNVGRGELKMTDPEVEAVIKKITTRGPAFTKSRLDLDMFTDIRDPETGESFPLLDLYDNDQVRLAQNYARRASGEVALAKYGVMGDEGLTILRDSLSFGRDGQKLTGQALDDAVKAFEQIASEFMGRPFGQSEWFRAADNLRLLTGASRLGGMAFTQLGEYANALPALGVSHTLSAVKAFPRLINEIRTGKDSPLLKSIELVGGEFGTDYKVNFPHQNIDDTFVHGQESMGTFTRLVRAGANMVPHINGWHYVHAAQVRGMSEQILHKAVRRVKNGGDDIALDDMGINASVRAALKKDMSKIAKFDKKGNLVEFDIEKMTNVEAARDFVQAVNRGSKQIIQGSYIGETGKWAHNDLLRVLTQFRTFSLVSMEKQWTRQMAMKGGLKTFGLLLGAMSFAMPIHLARIYANSFGRADREEYIEDQLNPMLFGRAVLNYASLSGMASDMLDVGAALISMTEGVTGLESGLDMTGVRGLSDGDIGAIIPGAGYANSVLRGLTSGDPAALLRTLPGGNVPFAVPLINAINAKENDPDWDTRDF